MSRSSSVRAREQIQIIYQQNNSKAFMSSCQLESGINSTNLTSPKTFTTQLSPKSTYLNNNNMIQSNNIKPSALVNNLNSSYSKMYISGGSANKFQNTMTSSVSTGNTARIASSQAFLSRNQRGNSVSKAVSAAASGVNSNRSSTDNLKNKENFNNSLSKIFFNSPRYKPNTSGIEQNPKIKTPDQSHQYIPVLKPSNNLSDRKRQTSNENSIISDGSYMKSSQTIFTNVINNNNQNSNYKTSSNKKLQNNNYSNIKQSLVLTKNINLKESNSNLNKSQQSSRSFRGNESDSKLIPSQIQNSNNISSSSKNINLTLNRPASTSNVERSIKLSDSSQKIFPIQKEKEEKTQLVSNQSRKSLGNSAQRVNSNLNLLTNNQNGTNDTSSQRPSTQSRMSTDSQSFNNVSSNLSKVNQQVKSTTNFTASKKLLSSQTFQLNNPCNSSQTVSDTQNQIYSTKVNNFMKQFQNQPSSKFNTTSKAIYDKNINDQKTNDQDISKSKDELKEYQKLQEKLSYLETKIMNIKTNIDTNYQKEVLKQPPQTQQKQKLNQDEQIKQQQQVQQQSQQQQNLQQQYQEYQQQHQQQQKQYNQQIEQCQKQQYEQQQQNQQQSNQQSVTQSSQVQKQPSQTNTGFSLTQKINSNSLNQTSSQLSSTLNTGRITEQKTLTNVPDAENERESSIYSQVSLQKPLQSQSQIINTFSQTNIEERLSDNEIKQTNFQQQPLYVQPTPSPAQQTQKSSGGISSFITQVNQGQSIPFSLTKSKGETNSTKSSTSQLQTIKPSAVQNQLKKQNTNGNMNNSLNKSNQNSTIKTQKQTQAVTQQQLNNSSTNSNSNSYKSFAFKSGQNSYSQQNISQKSAISGFNSNQQQLQIQNAQNNTLPAQPAQNNENDMSESQIQRLSIQSMKSLTLLNQLNGVNQKQQSPYIQPKQSHLYYASSIIKGYQNISDNHPLQILARDHLIQTIQSIQFSKHMQVPSAKQIEQKKVYFNPLKENKKTLIFDLDETLIHCNENVNIPSDVIVPIVFPTGDIIEAGINVRPFAVQILQELSKIYEIVIFTASHSCYANVVLDYLDPQNQYISYRLFREHCIQTEDGVYVKDLRVIGNRNMSDMIIVDNAAYSFAFQIDNGLPIIPFYDNKQDLELKYLITYMKSIQSVRDFREVNKKLLKIGQYSDFMDPIQLLETLYPDLIKM